MVVTGFRRNVRIVALENASEVLDVESLGEGGLVDGGVGGRRSFYVTFEISKSLSRRCHGVVRHVPGAKT